MGRAWAWWLLLAFSACGGKAILDDPLGAAGGGAGGPGGSPVSSSVGPGPGSGGGAACNLPGECTEVTKECCPCGEIGMDQLLAIPLAQVDQHMNDVCADP